MTRRRTNRIFSPGSFRPATSRLLGERVLINNPLSSIRNCWIPALLGFRSGLHCRPSTSENDPPVKLSLASSEGNLPQELPWSYLSFDVGLGQGGIGLRYNPQ